MLTGAKSFIVLVPVTNAMNLFRPGKDGALTVAIIEIGIFLPFSSIVTFKAKIIDTDCRAVLWLISESVIVHFVAAYFFLQH